MNFDNCTVTGTV